MSSSKQNCRNSLDIRQSIIRYHSLRDGEFKNIVFLGAFVVALVMTYRKGIVQINLENASTHTRIAVFPALLRGNIPIYSMKIFCIGLCATSDANNPSIEFCVGLLRARVWQARSRERISLSIPFKINWNGSLLWS